MRNPETRSIFSFLRNQCNEFTEIPPIYVLDTPASHRQYEMSERLITSFHLMMDYERVHGLSTGGMWDGVLSGLGDVVNLLKTRDVRGFAEYMRNAMRAKICHGLGPGPAVFNAFASGGDDLTANVMLIVDKLISLGIALGVMSEETPEQGSWGRHFETSIADLVKRSELKAGMKLGRPPVMGSFGLDFEGSVIDVRAVEDFYCTLKMREMLVDLEPTAEIGGGFGGMALQLYRAGFPKVHVFDLPLICMVSAWHLMGVYGPETVGLFGETAGDQSIFIHPYWEFQDSGIRFAAVFNRDSIPEMPLQAAREYLGEIARRRIPFLSINQEAAHTSVGDLRQLRVGDLAEEVPLRRTSRSQYWLRKGYVEEVFSPVERAVNGSQRSRLAFSRGTASV